MSPRRQGYVPRRKQLLSSAAKERALLAATLAAAFDSVITGRRWCAPILRVEDDGREVEHDKRSVVPPAGGMTA